MHACKHIYAYYTAIAFKQTNKEVMILEEFERNSNSYKGVLISP
jgi:hypothetical protein